MFRFVALCFGMLVRLFRGRHSLLLENLALRQTTRRAEASTSSPTGMAASRNILSRTWVLLQVAAKRGGTIFRTDEILARDRNRMITARQESFIRSPPKLITSCVARLILPLNESSDTGIPEQDNLEVYPWTEISKT
jgi:hypothetical protein